MGNVLLVIQNDIRALNDRLPKVEIFDISGVLFLHYYGFDLSQVNFRAISLALMKINRFICCKNLTSLIFQRVHYMATLSGEILCTDTRILCTDNLKMNGAT